MIRRSADIFSLESSVTLTKVTVMLGVMRHKCSAAFSGSAYILFTYGDLVVSLAQDSGEKVSTLRRIIS